MGTPEQKDLETLPVLSLSKQIVMAVVVVAAEVRVTMTVKIIKMMKMAIMLIPMMVAMMKMVMTLKGQW